MRKKGMNPSMHMLRGEEVLSQQQNLPAHSTTRITNTVEKIHMLNKKPQAVDYQYKYERFSGARDKPV